jgi:hypothetical protein
MRFKAMLCMISFNIYGLDASSRKKIYWISDLQVVSILPEPTLWPRDILQVDEETRQQLLNLRNHMDRFINQPEF